MAFAPDAATSGRFFVNFTSPDGNIVVARFRRSPANAPTADALVALRLDLAGQHAVHPASRRPATTMAAISSSVRTATCTSARVTVAAATTRATTRRTRSRCLARCCGSTSTLPMPIRPAMPSRPATRSWTGSRSPRSHEIWSFGLRNPWRYSFDDVGSGRDRGAGDWRRRAERARRSGLRAGRRPADATTDGACARARSPRPG